MLFSGKGSSIWSWINNPLKWIASLALIAFLFWLLFWRTPRSHEAVREQAPLCELRPGPLHMTRGIAYWFYRDENTRLDIVTRRKSEAILIFQNAINSNVYWKQKLRDPNVIEIFDKHDDRSPGNYYVISNQDVDAEMILR